LIPTRDVAVSKTFVAAAASVLLGVVSGCGNRLQSQDADVPPRPQDVGSDPSAVVRWEASRWNAFKSKLEFVPLKGFRDKLTQEGYAEGRAVAVELCGALDSGVAAEQRLALKRLVEDEPRLYSKARAAIYREYQRSYDTYKQALLLGSALFGAEPAEASKLLPEIVKGNELDGLVSFQTLYISLPEDGVCRIGVTLDCPWDPEHGMGLLIAGGEVERVGDSATAFVGMMPKPPGLTNLENGNVAIYVGNMAVNPRSIDIVVGIDGSSAANGEFALDPSRPFVRYLVKLAPGEHRLKVTSERGQATGEATFTVKDQAHVAISYYHPARGWLEKEAKPIFTINAEDRPSIPESLWRPGK
jgi:hypothetical protein